MTTPPLTRLAASLSPDVPFTGPEALERRRGAPFAARLGANESAFGPSPAAVAAMGEAAADAWMYGDPDNHALRAALADRLRVPAANLALGEGIDGLLGLLVRLTVAPGDPVVTSAGAYPTFGYHVAGFGGRLVQVPYRDDREDPAALLAAAHDTGARLIYLSNPDNPMGSWHEAGTLHAMIDALPDGAVLVLDEAYGEFAPSGSVPTIDPDDPRVIRMRTFSKAHGLAGLRVGYAITAAPLAAAFDRVRNHFGIGRIAQAGALAALDDAAWLSRVADAVADGRNRIAEIARDAGLSPLPSATNFVAIDCGRDGAYARRVLDALADEGVFVRMPGVAPLDRCIRVTVGRPPALDLFARALPRALDRANRVEAEPGRVGSVS